MTSKVDKLDVNTLRPIPANLKNLSDVYIMLLKRLYIMNWLKNAIDINGLVKKEILILKSMRLKVKYLVLPV